jgi:hypothetical protein
MEAILQALLSDLERSGSEPVGVPVRAVTALASDLGALQPEAGDALARRRRRAAAARIARRALSLATAVHAVVADRPDAARAWAWNVREVGRRLGAREPDPQACVRALSRAAALALQLPPAEEGDEWQVSALAFAEEGVLAELHDACLELATAALRIAASR